VGGLKKWEMETRQMKVPFTDPANRNLLKWKDLTVVQEIELMIRLKGKTPDEAFKKLPPRSVPHVTLITP
jgi:hypothetical protein